MKYSISIVSHNQIDLCYNAIKSILNHLNDFELILTINIPEPLDSIKEIEKKLLIIKNDKPLGFGENHNNAFKKSKGDIFMIVNPDIEISLWAELTYKPNILYSPMILNIDGSAADSNRAFPTPLNLIKRKILKLREDKLDWFAGVFLIISRESFEKLKGFDTSYFMYLEDTDLSLRFQKQGGILKLTNELVVIHDARRSSLKDIKFFKYHLSSLIRFYLKHPLKLIG